MVFVQAYKGYDIFKTHEGQFVVAIDSPDGSLPCAKDLSSFEDATRAIDYNFCYA